MNYLQVQNIAKTTMAYARQSIKPGMSLTEVRRLCETKMRALGADSFWYWNIGALVFSGDETAQSVSGRKYKTSDRIIEPNDIITIDLSPQVGNIWGDYARTVILQDGEVVKTENVKNSEWKQGLQTEDFLHKALCAFATPQTTFEEVYFHMNLSTLILKEIWDIPSRGANGIGFISKKAMPPAWAMRRISPLNRISA